MGVVAIIGLVCLAVAFAYGVVRSRSRTRSEARRTEAATNAQYDRDGGDVRR